MTEKTGLSPLLVVALKEFANRGLTDDEFLNGKLKEIIGDVKANSYEPLVFIGKYGLSGMNVEPTQAVSMLIKAASMKIDDTGDDHNQAAFEAIYFLSMHLSAPIKKDVQAALLKYVKDRKYVEPEKDGQDD